MASSLKQMMELIDKERASRNFAPFDEPTTKLIRAALSHKVDVVATGLGVTRQSVFTTYAPHWGPAFLFDGLFSVDTEDRG